MSAEFLKQIIDNAQMPEWERAVKALQASFAWCKQAATARQVKEGVPADKTPKVKALQFLLFLYDALKEGVEYLESLKDLLDTAEPGPTLQKELLTKHADLEDVAKSLAQLQEELKQLVQVEEELKRKVKEQERLRSSLASRKAELERLSQLANPEAVEALQAQVNKLEKRLQDANVEKEVVQLEERLREEAGKLIVLQESHLQALHPQVNALLKKAEDLERELQENKTKLAYVRARYEQARSELEKVKEELEPYIEANKVVAQALSGTDDIIKLLEDAKSLFSRAEEALKLVMEKSEKEAQLPGISITGEPLQR